MKKNIIRYSKKIYFNGLLVSIFKKIIPLILIFFNTNIKKVEGQIPQKGPLLIVAHHEELTDQFILGLPIKRRLFWIADTTSPHHPGSLADAKFVKWLLLRFGAIPIDKKRPERNYHLFDYLLYLLDKGESIVFFPEEYLRSERDGKRFGSFKDGVISLALDYRERFKKDIPIYPVGLKYLKKNGLTESYIRIGDKIIINNKQDRKKVFNKVIELSS
ncbi:MAG: 1-acyl-sn-glycerol-3-phosphate acyltransferase [Nanoarchaeota archaeon]